MNRYYRRLRAQEERRMAKHFNWIVQRFLEAIFDEDYCRANYYRSYQSIYSYYRGLWEQQVIWYNRFRAKQFKADAMWFVNQFKPVENV
jgi:hypothetical protein